MHFSTLFGVQCTTKTWQVLRNIITLAVLQALEEAAAKRVPTQLALMAPAPSTSAAHGTAADPFLEVKNEDDDEDEFLKDPVYAVVTPELHPWVHPNKDSRRLEMTPEQFECALEVCKLHPKLPDYIRHCHQNLGVDDDYEFGHEDGDQEADVADFVSFLVTTYHMMMKDDIDAAAKSLQPPITSAAAKAAHAEPKAAEEDHPEQAAMQPEAAPTHQHSVPSTVLKTDATPAAAAKQTDQPADVVMQQKQTEAMHQPEAKEPSAETSELHMPTAAAAAEETDQPADVVMQQKQTEAMHQPEAKEPSAETSELHMPTPAAAAEETDQPADVVMQQKQTEAMHQPEAKEPSAETSELHMPTPAAAAEETDQPADVVMQQKQTEAMHQPEAKEPSAETSEWQVPTPAAAAEQTDQPANVAMQQKQTEAMHQPEAKEPSAETSELHMPTPAAATGATLVDVIQQKQTEAEQATTQALKVQAPQTAHPQEVPTDQHGVPSSSSRSAEAVPAPAPVAPSHSQLVAAAVVPPALTAPAASSEAMPIAAIGLKKAPVPHSRQTKLTFPSPRSGVDDLAELTEQAQIFKDLAELLGGVRKYIPLEPHTDDWCYWNPAQGSAREHAHRMVEELKASGRLLSDSHVRLDPRDRNDDPDGPDDAADPADPGKREGGPSSGVQARLHSAS